MANQFNTNDIPVGGASIVDGVPSLSSVWSSQYTHDRRLYSSTQWSNTIAYPISIHAASNGVATRFNFLSLLTNANKISGGTDTGYIDELSITDTGQSSRIITPWRNNGRVAIFIRCVFFVESGTSEEFALTLRRGTELLVLAQEDKVRSNNVLLERKTVNFLTYTGSDTDAFVTQGFNLNFENTSNQVINLKTSFNLLVEMFYSHIPDF